MNYFEFYDIPVAFNLDEAQVKRKFYELSKTYHPDFYINHTEEKQQEILELSTINNKAYQVLSNPVKRLEYILQLHGQAVEGEKYQLPQEFLMEMMEVNEALMELEFEPDQVVLDNTGKKISEIESDLIEELQGLTDSFDKQNNDENENHLLKIKDIYYRQKYLLRIRDSLNKFASR
ncbi:MAG: Fe-S protein assembly co-chaperone HscB [Sphingobacteriaceae bacterium]|nr:Fe-S protein assembly co-chaperone HscB [Sphingobacteriaceae bacterium]